MEWVDPIIQLVTTGGFGAILWWLLIKHIPRVEQSHCERIDKIEQRHAEERVESDERHKAEREAFMDQLAQRDQHLLNRLDQITGPLVEIIRRTHED